MKPLALTAFVMCGLLPGIALAKRAPPPEPMRPVQEEKKIDAPALLRTMDIAATPEGVTKFLHDLEKGRFAPLAPAEVDRLIATLGSDSFREREQAVRTLAAQLRPPIEKLRKAAAGGDTDLEISRRARQILNQVENRPDPIELLFMVVKDKKLNIPTTQVIELTSHSDRLATLELAHLVLLPLLKPSDADLVKTWLAGSNVPLKATGVRFLPFTMPKAEVVPALTKYLKDDSEIIRGMAARTLVSHGALLSPAELAASVDIDSLALVYRAADYQYRQASRDRVHEPKTFEQHQKMALQHVDVLKKTPGVKHEIRQAANNLHWINLGMKSEAHPEVLLYRIRWFNGNWSHWMVPGYNDKITDGRAIRFWACFNDHEHEIITTTRKELFRQVEDLP